MMRALNTAGTGMVAQQINLDVLANNLANVNTTAFKQQRAEFQDLVYQVFRAAGNAEGGAPQAAQVGLGTKFSASAANMAQGSFQATGQPLDLAVMGEGFFRVIMPDGSFAYTRDGSFTLDSNGTLVTRDGFEIDGGITITEGSTEITVSDDGTVRARPPAGEEAETIGQLQLYTFPNVGGLARVGQNLFRENGSSGVGTAQTPGANGAGQIQSGFLEGSNVQIVEEMVRMILAQRAYEINSKAIQTADDMLNTANQLKR